MQTRREFLKTAAVLSGAIGLWDGLEDSVQTAMAIEPAPGSTYLDAEHVVILMQENRSFDHAYGTLRGVRGYNDPRAITLANGNPVWIQTNAAGESYAPFRLNLIDTKATWMGYLPHSWTSQVDARNGGLHDRWLDAKRSPRKEYAAMPLTLGHYTRDDIPFYYALADAFTICDQHFCSSITPTLPNRLYYWTGTVRERPEPGSTANVRNEQVERNAWANWTTFPERLEQHGIPWKVYQNELTVPSGLSPAEDDWLSNFGCNILEYFPQFHVRAHPLHREWVLAQEKALPGQIAAVEAQLAKPGLSADESAKLTKQLNQLRAQRKSVEEERAQWDRDDPAKLSPHERSLHERAFCTNRGDPGYRELVEMTFKDGDVERRVKVPKGDVFHQFREDVKNDKLPTVSWLVAPQKLSDHPDSAWYGAWYVSETLRILTENPEVWRKTIFILTYDENDGYFDHVPPFVAPRPDHPETGATSKGVDATTDYVELEQDRKVNQKAARGTPIGLGYRVPLVIASPWSRGGCVNSQVCDSTSVLQFLETFLSNKTRRPIKEANISSWRRAVCGDLTSAFRPAGEEKERTPAFLSRDRHVEQIFRAQFKPVPSGFKALTANEVDQIRRDPRASQWMPRQEPGVRRSCPLPYELYVDGALTADRSRVTVRFRAGTGQFAGRSAGCPFACYARLGGGRMLVRHYAVAAGEVVEDSWPLADFDGGAYHLEVHGPNGFLREFVGTKDDPRVDVSLEYGAAAGRTFTGDVSVRVANRDAGRACDVDVLDASYGAPAARVSVAAGAEAASAAIATSKSFRWYDAVVTVSASPRFSRRFAGRVENGDWSFSDPAMAGAAGGTPR